jgi:hypothetical protein
MQQPTVISMMELSCRLLNSETTKASTSTDTRYSQHPPPDVVFTKQMTTMTTTTTTTRDPYMHSVFFYGTRHVQAVQ